MKQLFFLFLLLITTTFLNAQNYQLVWSDEFDGTTINTANWTHETGGGGWGNNELEYYTNRSVNSYIENGNLVIQALKESYGGRSYTSARMISKDKKYFTYGKIEARIKLPYGKGIWPAFWTLGQNIASVGWPTCGEIDIMELIGGGVNDKKVYGTAHWNSNGHASYGGNYSLGTGIFADAYHIFSITWDSKMIRWYVDGFNYVSIDISPAGLAAFQKNHFILLNLAVGGNWPGSPDASTAFPQKMYVDYVRVYQDVPVNVDEGALTPAKEFHLDNNYPNPFNPETKIGYRIPVPSSSQNGNTVHVTLKVSDILGNEVAMLVNEDKPAGSYSVTFDAGAGAFPSGIYYCTMTAGNFRETKKMVLLK